jgi:hypothetical protein
MRFRASRLRGRARGAVVLALGLIALLTLIAAWLPAYVPEGRFQRSDILLLLPSGYLGVLVIATVSAVASGGGRELLPRDQAVAFPVSPTTDHLGALLMAPLNVAWLTQSWVLLAATAYVVGPHPRLLLAQAPVLVWLVAATAVGQLVAWAAEWVRRGPYGVLLIRGLIVTVLLGTTVLVVTGRFVNALGHSPTMGLTTAALSGASGQVLPWLKAMAALVLVAGGAVALGAVMATMVSRRPARDELRVESAVQSARPNPRSDFAALRRTDRCGIWRSVPLRRGLAVLTLLPGLVALAGGLEWQTVTILPGLVASGGALLFGVNSWCLDGRGALWRDSLPLSPRLAFAARAAVLVEVLLLASLVTLVLASLRAGPPTASQLAAVGCAAVVVCVQVVATSLRWSVKRPFAVDMRSARATPAPPLVMVGYSSRLALSTTMTGLVFSATARVSWQWSVLLALPFLLLSAYRLLSTSRRWADPEVRCRVVTTVAS